MMKAHHFSASRFQSMSRQNFPSPLIDHYPGCELVLDIAEPYFSLVVEATSPPSGSFVQRRTLP